MGLIQACTLTSLFSYDFEECGHATLPSVWALVGDLRSSKVCIHDDFIREDVCKVRKTGLYIVPYVFSLVILVNQWRTPMAHSVA